MLFFAYPVFHFSLIHWIFPHAVFDFAALAAMSVATAIHWRQTKLVLSKLLSSYSYRSLLLLWVPLLIATAFSPFSGKNEILQLFVLIGTGTLLPIFMGLLVSRVSDMQRYHIRSDHLACLIFALLMIGLVSCLTLTGFGFFSSFAYKDLLNVYARSPGPFLNELVTSYNFTLGLFCLLLLVAFIPSSTTFRSGYLYIPLGFLAVVCFLFTKSRMPFVVSVIVGLSALTFAWGVRKGLFLLGVVGLVAAIGFFTAQKTFLKGNESERLIIYGATIKSISERPLIGWGYRSAIHRANELIPEPHPKGYPYQNHHSSYLQLAADGGSFALLAFFSFILFWFREALQTGRAVPFALPLLFFSLCSLSDSLIVLRSAFVLFMICYAAHLSYFIFREKLS